VREFIYLNNALVDQFLAQLEDGLYDEQQEKEKNTGDRKGGASFGMSGAKIEGNLGSGNETERSRTRRQTPESRFNRLADLVVTLPEDEHVTIDETSTGFFAAVRPGRLVTAGCYMALKTRTAG
jgi:hypothetical protein